MARNGYARGAGGGAVYGLGLIGALVYYIQDLDFVLGRGLRRLSGIGLAGVPCVRGATLAEAVAIRRVRARGRRLRLGRHTGPLPMLSSAPVSAETPSSPERGDRDDRGDFIREIVAARPSRGPVEDRRHPLPARAERLPPHRPRQVDLPQLRPRRGVRRQVQPALRRHEPETEEQEYVESIEDDVRWLGFDWEEHLYYASDYFEQLYEFAVEAHRGRQGVRRQPQPRRDPRAPRRLQRAGRGEPVPRAVASPRTSTSSRACAPASSPTARTCCAPRSTWRRPT